jgi:hypothetical protein
MTRQYGVAGALEHDDGKLKDLLKTVAQKLESNASTRELKAVAKKRGLVFG